MHESVVIPGSGEHLIIERNTVLTGTHTSSIEVEKGHFVLQGTLKGSLAIHYGATAEISGTIMGSVAIARGATLQVKQSGVISGSAAVGNGAVLLIDGKLAGSLANHGKVILRGVFGGSRAGDGQLTIEGNGYIKPPNKVVDGVATYEW